LLASTPTGLAQLDLCCRFPEADRAADDVSALTVEVDFAGLPAVIVVLARFM
jgi:hypothetical protein